MLQNTFGVSLDLLSYFARLSNMVVCQWQVD